MKGTGRGHTYAGMFAMENQRKKVFAGLPLTRGATFRQGPGNTEKKVANLVGQTDYENTDSKTESLSSRENNIVKGGAKGGEWDRQKTWGSGKRNSWGRGKRRKRLGEEV